jgi:ABC-type branched-subunit amino acid transport system substrate-binding protein
MWLAHYHVDISTPENKKFVAEFRKKYSADPVDTSAFYYDAMKVLMKIHEKDTDAFESLKTLGYYQSVTGPVYIHDRFVTRAMPLLSLKEGQVVLESMITPKDFK